VSQRVIEWMRIDVARVHWFSTYRVHHRVADRFGKGRAFLLGDAAHIHSPVGGQGMNTGIGDAVNLAWKIADVIHGRAKPSLLDSYEPERIAFARRLVATTDQVFTGVTSDGAIARRVRLQIVPAVAPVLFAFKAMRRFMFRTISQTAMTIAMRAELGSGGRYRVRQASVAPRDKGVSLTTTALRALDWQLHVYGRPAPALAALCEAPLPLRRFRGAIRCFRASPKTLLPDTAGRLRLRDRRADAARLESGIGWLRWTRGIGRRCRRTFVRNLLMRAPGATPRGPHVRDARRRSRARSNGPRHRTHAQPRTRSSSGSYLRRLAHQPASRRRRSTRRQPLIIPGRERAHDRHRAAVDRFRTGDRIGVPWLG
jgi:hypothetical protein